MAQNDIAGLLTGVGSAPIDPMQGASLFEREVALQQRALANLRGGINALTGGRVDARTTQEKAQEALAKLDSNNPEDRKKIIQIVQNVDPRRVPALREAFRKSDEEKRKGALDESNTERRLVVAEEELAMRKAAQEAELNEQELILAQQAALRQMLVQMAVEANNPNLANALAQGLDVSVAQNILFGSSNAVVKAPTADEEAAMERLLETDELQGTFDNLKTGVIWKTLNSSTKKALFFKAKELMIRNKLSIEEALKQAVTALGQLENVPTGPGAETPTKEKKVKERGKGATKLETNEEGVIDASNINIKKAKLMTRKERREAQQAPFKARAAEEAAQEAAEVQARKEAAGHIITLNDIMANNNLQEAGVLPGDRIVDNELVRVFSSDDDFLDIQHTLTRQDIAANPNLQEAGAVSGDLIIKNQQGELEFLSRNRESQLRQFLFSYQKNANYAKNGLDFLDAISPIPSYAKGYTTPYGYNPTIMIDFTRRTLEEEYGDENIRDLTFEERRLAVKRRNERALLKMFGPMFDYDPGSAGAIAGAVTKAVIDPINLIPAASTVKGGIALGTAIAGFGSIADDLIHSESGEVDPLKAAVSAATGGVLSGAFVKGTKVLMDRGAKKTLRKAQLEVDKGIREGADPSDPVGILLNAGLDPQEVLKAQQRLGVKIRIRPDKVEEAQVDKIITKDSAVGRYQNTTANNILGTLSTNIRQISEKAFGRLRKFEFDSHTRTADTLKEVEPFLRSLSDLPATTKNSITRALYNEDFVTARSLMTQGMQDEFDMIVEPLLRRLGDELLESGHSFQKIENYFPRLVKDVKGLQDSLGVEQQGLIEKAIRQFADRKKIDVSKVTDEEKTEIIDKLAMGYRMRPKADGKPGFARERKLTLTEDQIAKYYASPEESLSIYLRRAVNDIEQRRFFGRSAVNDEGTGLIDMDASIGKLVKDELAEGKLSLDDEGNLIELLSTRFIGGNQSPNSVNATIRDLGYLGTISNPISAITQLGDLGTSAALKGFRHTIASVFGSKNYKLIDVGIDEVSKEFSEGSARTTSRILSKALGASAFRRIDRLGKETLINASYKNARKMLRTKKGEAEFRRKHSGVYGDEIDTLIADLKAGNRSANTKLFLFNELADVQPIALSEFPPSYLRNPDHRILYMLKSFTLKQYDIVRREVVGEWAKGNKKEAIKTATALAAYMTAANTGTKLTKDILLGREVRPEDIPSEALWSLLGVYGLNKYTADKYWSKGDWKGAVYQQIAPATPIIDASVNLASAPFEDDVDLGKIVRPVPIIGPLIYNWFLGGAEKYNERKERERD